MDSSPVLRQQSQNKIHSDILRLKNENNKMSAHPKPSKLLSAPHLSNQDTENKDPGNSEMGRKAPVRPGVSRLPVLAKSLHLQTPSDFSQSHCRWEEKPLAGKARKKKPCTRPIPFNLSQPKSSRTATENQQHSAVSQSRTGYLAVQPDNNVHSAHLKTPNMNAKPSKNSTTSTFNMDSTKGSGKSHGKATEKAPQLSGMSGPFNAFKTSATSSNPLSSISNNTMHQNSTTSSAQAALNTEACLDNMNLLSLKDLTKTSTSSQNMQLTGQSGVSKSSTDKGETFQPDHAALLSILRNEGVSTTGLGSATPQSKSYNYLPQRVSVMKSRKKVGPTSDKGETFQPDNTALLSILRNEGVSTTGLGSATPQSKSYNYLPQRVSVMKSRQKVGPTSDKGETFQPDHAALLSILRNEGVSTTGLGSATPQSKSYNYLPQRVSVMKSRQKVGPTSGFMKSVQFSPDPVALQSILQNEGVKLGGPVGATPLNSVRASGRGTSIYTPQRVPARKKVEATGGPVAALKESSPKKWTPQRVRNTKHQPMSAMKWHMSSQQSPYGGTPGPRSCKTNLQPHQEEVVQKLFDDQEDEQSRNMADKDPETQTEQLQETSTKSHCEEKTEMCRANSNEDEEQSTGGGQPFIQAPQRESVIFFSTGKKLSRAPRFEQQESSAHHEQPGPVSSEQMKVLPEHEETTSVSERTRQINPSVQSLHRDLFVPKTCALSSAAAMLRKRLPPLEEILMDEEVATYTSLAVPLAPGFVPPRPRCGNPLASILHFEESSRFVPIVCDLLSGPSSPQSSPLQER